MSMITELIERLRGQASMLDENDGLVVQALKSSLVESADTIEELSFINKPCVSEKACEHDKQIVLDKIRAEIVAYDDLIGHNAQVRWCLKIIDKYKAESDGEE